MVLFPRRAPPWSSWKVSTVRMVKGQGIPAGTISAWSTALWSKWPWLHRILWTGSRSFPASPPSRVTVIRVCSVTV